MADKEIRKLRRSELIEIIYQLKKSEQELQQQVESLQAQLRDRNVKIEKAGSIAEAALAISDIFVSAQAAADTYLNEIKRRHAAAEIEGEKIIAEARNKASAIIQEAVRRKELIDQQCTASRDELQKVQQILHDLSSSFNAGK